MCGRSLTPDFSKVYLDLRLPLIWALISHPCTGVRRSRRAEWLPNQRVSVTVSWPTFRVYPVRAESVPRFSDRRRPGLDIASRLELGTGVGRRREWIGPPPACPVKWPQRLWPRPVPADRSRALTRAEVTSTSGWMRSGCCGPCCTNRRPRTGRRRPGPPRDRPAVRTGCPAARARSPTARPAPPTRS